MNYLLDNLFPTYMQKRQFISLTNINKPFISTFNRYNSRTVSYETLKKYVDSNDASLNLNSS